MSFAVPFLHAFQNIIMAVCHDHVSEKAHLNPALKTKILQETVMDVCCDFLCKLQEIQSITRYRQSTRFCEKSVDGTHPISKAT